MQIVKVEFELAFNSKVKDIYQEWAKNLLAQTVHDQLVDMFNPFGMHFNSKVKITPI